jgi:hypothetical protein
MKIVNSLFSLYAAGFIFFNDIHVDLQNRHSNISNSKLFAGNKNIHVW